MYMASIASFSIIVLLRIISRALYSSGSSWWRAFDVTELLAEAYVWMAAEFRYGFRMECINLPEYTCLSYDKCCTVLSFDDIWGIVVPH
uniref:Uncharacterized protein n=1 Tax=viral metagenome TaxID=1070528 RepID=A0A6C0EVA2_9ZZZZ